MSFDVSGIAPEMRTIYIRLGRRFSSRDTLAQANKHVSALEKYGVELVRHGFSVADGQQLGGGRDALVAAGAGRTGAQGDDRATTLAHREVLAVGRQERLSARGVLGATARARREAGGEAALATAAKIEGKLRQTRKSPENDGEKVAEQLEVLRATMVDPEVAAAAIDRGGPEAVVSLDGVITRLRASNKAVAGRGTRAETEHLDLLDGLVVTLARSARKAAVAAARRLGTPAVAAAFALSELPAPAQRASKRA